MGCVFFCLGICLAPPIAAADTQLAEKLYETAYALAVEVAAADLDVGQEELRFLEMLQDKLGLDALVKTAIERGARARHSIA